MPRNLQIILAYLLIFIVTIVKCMLRKNNKNISGKLISEYIFDLMLSLSLVFNNGILFIGSALVALLNVVINTYFTKQDNRELGIKSFVNLKVIIGFISILLSVTYLLKGDGYFGFNFISNADVSTRKILYFINIPVSIMLVGLIYKEAKKLKNYRYDKLFLILMLILLLIIIGMSFNNLRLLG